ncbi:hypothetical protein FGG08_002255 [Glutinoglossum americanum]|uniref:Pyridoxamine phosphate oxidase family protein n=1 Tax=Glutinoglossum americanum TaxID=1670608 RepID=A0A9P8L5Q3_9PEZI|nr:hypothetical protein FGG08_002255 [Glutinoglossum americanum]
MRANFLIQLNHHLKTPLQLRGLDLNPKTRPAMPRFYPSITPSLAEWALSQPVFFTASAPLAGRHVNLSPKGLPGSTFTIFDANHAAYIDATGSGCETISHIYENGRVTVMFCSFDVTPRILRLFCRGRVVEYDEPGFEPTIKRMGKERIDGARAVVLLDVWMVQTSCGFGVPIVSYNPRLTPELFQDRGTLGHKSTIMCEKGEIISYQAEWNADSLDGLTGLRSAMRSRGQRIWWEGFKAWLRRMVGQREAVFVGIVIGLLLGGPTQVPLIEMDKLSHHGICPYPAKAVGFDRPHGGEESRTGLKAFASLQICYMRSANSKAAIAEVRDRL